MRYILGKRLRKWFGIETIEEVMQIGKILYNAIGIEIYRECAGRSNGKALLLQPVLYQPGVQPDLVP